LILRIRRFAPEEGHKTARQGNLAALFFWLLS
jgi:hypothetical protein